MIAIDLSNNAIADVDTILIALAASVKPSGQGILDLSGGTNARPTAASNVATRTLAMPPYGWDITTN